MNWGHKKPGRACASAALAALLWLPLAAQTAPPASLGPLTAVTVSGSARFGQAQLVPATGLHLGQAMSVAAMNQAGKRLADSGDFASITYRYTYSAQGTKVQFAVTDQPHLLPIVFDNFVWLPRSQLLQWLHGKVPLFSGEVPLSGNLGQQIAAALQALLRQRGVQTATVQGLPFQAVLGTGPFDSYMFSVEGVKIPLQQIAFPGAPPALAADLQKQAASLIGQNYSRQRLDAAIQFVLLPDLQDRGFLQAKFAAPVIQLTDPAANTVGVTLAVDLGAQDRWGAVGFQGNTVFDSGKLQKLVKLSPGKRANRAVLDQDLTAIRTLYHNSGYLRVAITPKFKFSQPGLAATTLVINEGPQFRMGKVTLQGVTGNAGKELASLWQLKIGQPYRANYLSQYMGTLYRRFNFHGASINTRVIPDYQSHMVDISIVFARTGPGGGV